MEEKDYQVESSEKKNSNFLKWLGLGILTTILAVITMVVINL